MKFKFMLIKHLSFEITCFLIIKEHNFFTKKKRKDLWTIKGEFEMQIFFTMKIP